VRIFSILLVVMAALAACTPASGPTPIGSDGKPAPKVYRIRGDAGKLQLRMLDSVNALRQASGLGQVQLSSELIAAAATHSRDMAVQNRPWHFGSDASSPLDRVARAGYTGPLVGEVISETYETELETLGAWMEEPGSRSVILDPAATNMGFAWHQEPNGKLWWTMVMGG